MVGTGGCRAEINVLSVDQVSEVLSGAFQGYFAYIFFISWKCENNLPIIYGIKACAILWNLNGYPRSGSGSNKSTAVQTLNPAVLSHMSALNANTISLLFGAAVHN